MLGGIFGGLEGLFGLVIVGLVVGRMPPPETGRFVGPGVGIP